MKFKKILNKEKGNDFKKKLEKKTLI